MKKGILTGPSRTEQSKKESQRNKIGYGIFIVLVMISIYNFYRADETEDVRGAECYSICENNHLSKQQITEDVLPPCSECSTAQKPAFTCSACDAVFGLAFEELETGKICPSCNSLMVFKLESSK